MRSSCPACGPGSTSWTGAVSDFAGEVIPNGVSLWSAKSGNYPMVDLVRCKNCRQLWTVEHRYPDRPPYACFLTRTTEAEATHARSGSAEDFFALLDLQASAYPSLDKLLLGIVLNAPAEIRALIRKDPRLPTFMAEYWDRLVSWGEL